jgi:hypothetical protein
MVICFNNMGDSCSVSIDVSLSTLVIINGRKMMKL